jgi:adenylosuccinate synthase
MPYTAIVGLQWGDEGKGKVIDYLAKDYDAVVRFQGGANAGHTVYVNGKKFSFHILPSGLLREDVVGIIGPGVVIDPESFKNEVEGLYPHVGDLKGRLFVDPRAHIVMPYHKLEDALFEAHSEKPIGTTKRGIGPANRDKYARLGIRIGDILRPSYLKEHINRAYDFNKRIVESYGESFFDRDELWDLLMEFAEYVKPFVADTVLLLEDLEKSGARILLEGAQGTYLDVSFGTYPFVTSSHTISGSATVGSGIAPWKIKRVIGVFKAYTTRVGEGPFPTEEISEIGERMKEEGGEFGTTTGRARRCGWLDIPLIHYASIINGVTDLFVTKVDVLEKIGIYRAAVEYKLFGERISFPPAYSEDWYHIEPVYKDYPSWEEMINEIEGILKVEVRFVSTGKDREEVIERKGG